MQIQNTGKIDGTLKLELALHILSMIDIVRSNVAGGRVADPTPHLLLLKTRPRMPWLVGPPKVMLLSPSPRGPLRQPLPPFVIQSHHPKKRQRKKNNKYPK